MFVSFSLRTTTVFLSSVAVEASREVNVWKYYLCFGLSCRCHFVHSSCREADDEIRGFRTLTCDESGSYFCREKLMSSVLY